VDNFLDKKPECLVVKFEKLENLIAAGYQDGKILIYNREENNHKLLNESYLQKGIISSAITSLR
jgi:hypothetical protein